MSSLNNFAEYVKDPDYKKKLAPKKFKREIRMPLGYGKKQIDERWKVITGNNKKYSEWMKENEAELSISALHQKDVKSELLDEDSMERSDIYKNNIENYIGKCFTCEDKWHLSLLCVAPHLRLHAQGTLVHQNDQNMHQSNGYVGCRVCDWESRNEARGVSSHSSAACLRAMLTN